MMINGAEYEEESLIEICALPDVNTSRIIQEISLQNLDSVFIENTLNLSLSGLKALYIPGHVELFAKLEEIKYTWLFIDSIALYVDSIRETGDEHGVQILYNKLWGLIYDWKVTVIVTNHFKTVKDPIYYRVTPRLGFMWYKMCSYRIIVTKRDRLQYRVTKNNMFML